MGYYTRYDKNQDAVIVTLDPVDYSMITSCTQRCWLPMASISNEPDGNGYRYETWKYLDPGDEYDRHGVECYQFSNGQELAELLDITGFSDIENKQGLVQFSPELAVEYQMYLLMQQAC